jgi:hypothetical protein
VRLRVACAAVLLVTAALPDAVGAQAPAPQRIEFDRLVLNGGGQVGEVRTVAMGETILTAQIALGEAARTAAPIAVTAAGVEITIPAGTLLRGAQGDGANDDALGQTARLFCGAPVKVDEAAATARRFETDPRPCFVDTDADGRLEGVFIAGTRRAPDRVVTALEPARYELIPTTPLPDSEFTLFVGEGPDLIFDARILGSEPTVNGIRLMTGGRERTIPRGLAVRGPAYPMTVSYGPARFTVLGWNNDRRELRVRIDRGFENVPMRLRHFDNRQRVVIPVYIGR